ncbi:MAG: hypothetical protein V4674_00515 [Patescibacteria group bacterium]
MLSIEQTRKMLPEATQGLTDAEVMEIRDQTYLLAELAFDNWMLERKKKLAEARTNKKAP